MKTLLYFGLLLLLVWTGLFVYGRKKYGPGVEQKFLSREHTDILKGYAILGVLFGHVGQYAGVNGIEYPAGVGVSIFLILSGYGVAKSYEHTGLKGFWRKRALRVFLPYILAESLAFLIQRRWVGLSALLLDFSLLRPLHPFGWYLRFLLVCYIIFFCTYGLFRNRKVRAAALVSCFAAWFLIRSLVWIDPVPFLQARQILAFSCGLLLAALPTRSLKWGGQPDKMDSGFLRNDSFCNACLRPSSYGAGGFPATCSL